MGKLIEKATGKAWDVPASEMEDALASGFYESSDGGTTTITEGDITYSVPVDDLEYHAERGAKGESDAEVYDRLDTNRKERQHGGLGSRAATFVESGLSAATLGGYDVVGGIVGGDEFRTRRKESEEVNSTEAILGEVAGYALPGIGGVGKFLPIGAAERLGAKVAATGAGRGLMRSSLSKGAGLGLEGAVVGAGQTAKDYALATTSEERERAASTLSSNVLFGAATGGTLGAAGNAAGHGIRKAKKIADGISDRLTARANISDDIASLDKAGIREARTAEQARIGAELRDSANEYQRLFNEVDPILVASGESEKILISERNKIRRALGNQKGLAERPGMLKDALQRQEGALAALSKNRKKILADLAAEDASVLAKLPKKHAPLKGKAAKKYGQFASKKITKGMAKEGVEIAPAEMARFRAALSEGSIGGARAKALDGIDEVLRLNRAQLESTEALLKGSSPKLAELKAAEDALASGGAKKGFAADTAEKAVFGAIAGAASTVMPFSIASILASKASGSISDLVLGRLGKASQKAAKGTAAAVDKLLDASAKTMTKAPPLASKVLQTVRFAETTLKLADALPEATLVRDYKAREAEIYSKVTRGPNGITMRPTERKKLSESLSGVRLVSPELADSIETVANRRISFLASKLPKAPDFLAYKVGPDTWHPSREAIRTFARYVAAVDDPAGVEDRLADATITPQDVEAYKAVYPERYTAMRNDIAARLPELQANLPIAKRMALSIFTGLPVEPSMSPAIFERLQAQFEQEPGTEGGTMAPQAKPNFSSFGSIRSDDKTRSQKRAE